MAIYRELGYPVLLTSAKFGLGLEELQSVLRDKRSVLVGHSGVGKSKLAVAIEPSARLMSSELDRRGRGRHTTTASLLVPIEGGGELVDTPGIRELGIQHIPAEELADCYPSMRPFLSTCRFHPCSHVHEPDCAIKRAAREGQIPEIRYQSYVRLYEEITGSS